ncbi:MAG: hypothetical protein WA055_03380 [Candidatus Moraniibacteriota bacterium]
MLEFDIRRIDQTNAQRAMRLLENFGIKRSLLSLIHGRCLISVDIEDNIIAFAEDLSVKKTNNRGWIIYFRNLSKKQKSRMKVTFFNVIFSKAYWRRNAQTEKNKSPYMFC